MDQPQQVPRRRRRHGRLLTTAAAVVVVLLLAFAWGLGLVMDEAQEYALAHGTGADTSRDRATQLVVLVTAAAVASVLIAAQVRARVRHEGRGTTTRGPA